MQYPQYKLRIIDNIILMSNRQHVTSIQELARLPGNVT